MLDAAPVQAGFQRELRRLRLHRLVERGTVGVFVGGVLVVLALIGRWLLASQRPDPDAVALAWIFGLLLAGLIATTGLWLGAARRRRAARRLDDRAGAHGAILAALDPEAERHASRFRPLLVHRAGALAREAPRPARRDFAVVPLVGALGCVALSALLAFFGSNDAAATRIESFATAPLPGEEAKEEPGGAVSGAPAVPDLSELARLELATESRIVLPREDPQVWITLRQRGGVGRPLQLETILTLADGTPSPDVGLGIGMRPLPLDLPFTLAAQPGEPVRHRVALKPALEKYGMWRPGLITVQALARPRDEDRDVVSGGLVSNQLTIQIAENRERQRTRKPTPTENARTPRKSKPNPDKEKKGRGRRGGQKPELGAPDRLKDAKRKASAVKPLISDGPQVEKEVEVFEREKGGETVQPPRVQPMPEAPLRTFLERAEAEMRRLPLSPEDRVLLRRYFERLRK